MNWNELGLIGINRNELEWMDHLIGTRTLHRWRWLAGSGRDPRDRRRFSEILPLESHSVAVDVDMLSL